MKRSNPTMKNYSILLVDDEERLTQCLDMVLSLEGHKVQTASNGEDALKLIEDIYQQGNKLDLLITDIWMPGMSGLDLITKLNQQKIQPTTLGISGYTDSDTLEELYSKGCNDLIFKPFTPEELLCKITEVMESA
jgi:YesN/AraC family two-component response regulator